MPEGLGAGAIEVSVLGGRAAIVTTREPNILVGAQRFAAVCLAWWGCALARVSLVSLIKVRDISPTPKVFVIQLRYVSEKPRTVKSQ